MRITLKIFGMSVLLLFTGCNKLSKDEEKPVNISELNGCKASCTTDLESARKRLEKADFKGAYELYKCADTAEAAFGAGLTRFLTAFESQAAIDVLDHLGLPPLKVSDILGSDGLLSRLSTRWSGRGQLLVSGTFELETDFMKTIHEVDKYDDGYTDYEFQAVDLTSEHRAEISMYFDNSDIENLPANGELSQQFDCQEGRRTGGYENIIGSVNLQFYHGDIRYWCNTPYFLESEECISDGGTLTVVSAGEQIGDPVELRFERLLLTCEEDEDNSAFYESDEYDSSSMPSRQLVRLTGMFTTVAVNNNIDLTGLHPILNFEDEYPFDNVRSDSTLSDLLKGAAGITEEMVLASCYFNRAAEEGGDLGSIPGKLYGGQSMDITAGDAKVLSGAMALAAAAGQIVSAYEVKMPLSMLFCENDYDDDETNIRETIDCLPDESCEYPADDEPPLNRCPDDAAIAKSFNNGFGNSVDTSRFAAARKLVQMSLKRLEEGVDKLDNDSILISNLITLPGLGQLRDIIGAGLISLEEGMTQLPQVVPPLYFDLDQFFESPPSRDGITHQPIQYEQECDEYDCWSDTDLSMDFMDDFFDNILEVQWRGGDYEWEDSDSIEEGLEEMLRNLEHNIGIVLD